MTQTSLSSTRGSGGLISGFGLQDHLDLRQDLVRRPVKAWWGRPGAGATEQGEEECWALWHQAAACKILGRGHDAAAHLV